MYTMIRQPKHRRQGRKYWHGLGDAFSVADVQNDLQANGCPDISALQMGLNKLGYAQPALVVDGIVGPATATALTNFGINSNPTVNSNFCAAVAAAVASTQTTSAAPATQKTISKIGYINPKILNLILGAKKPLQHRAGIVATAEDWWTAQPTSMKAGIAVGGVAAVCLIAYLLIK